MKELIEKLEKLIALVEDIDSTLFHHNYTIDGYHLNGNTEPIMNFVADFDMEALTEAKKAIQSLTQEPSAESMREHSIGFAQWINKNSFVQDVFSCKRWVTLDLKYSGCVFADEELYTEYLNTLTTK